MLMFLVFWLLMLTADFWSFLIGVKGPTTKYLLNRPDGIVGWESQRSEGLIPGLYKFVEDNLRN